MTDEIKPILRKLKGKSFRYIRDENKDVFIDFPFDNINLNPVQVETLKCVFTHKLTMEYGDETFNTRIEICKPTYTDFIHYNSITGMGSSILTLKIYC